MRFRPATLRGVLNSRKDALHTPTYQDQTVKAEVSKTLRDTEDLLDTLSIHQSGNFAIWNDFWNRVGVFGVHRKEKSEFDRRQSRGRLLSIDYGHNIRYEFSFYHIGVVVADFPGMIVVVPVTSDRGQWEQYPAELRRAMVRVNSRQYPQFDHDSLLLVHQMRAVDKSRIRKDLCASIAKTPLMKDLEEKIAQLYSPFIIKTSREEIAQLRRELENAKRMIAELHRGREEVAATEKNRPEGH